LPILCEKIGVDLKNQCDDPNLTKIAVLLKKPIFANFCENFSKS
jgi:hypothetical protein